MMKYLDELEEENHFNTTRVNDSKDEISFRSPAEETATCWNESEVERQARKHVREVFEAKRNLARTKTLLASVTRVLDGLLEELERQILDM
jgi:hypothetical protein